VLLPKLVLAAILILAILDLLAGVFLRYVVVDITDYFDWPSVSFFWVEEIGEFALAWLTLVGAAVAIVERTHFALTVFVHHFSPRLREIIDRLNHLVIAGFGALAAGYGWRLAEINATLRSPGLEINLAWLYFSAVIGGGLMAVYGLAVALGILRLRDLHDVAGAA
jgi:TRAP-type C4-dicarboxylate transport system permease small subunit